MDTVLSLNQPRPIRTPKQKLPAVNAFGTNITTPSAVQMQPYKAGDINGAINSFTGATNDANAANNLRYNQGLNVLSGGNTAASGFISQAIANSDKVGYGARRDVRNQLQADMGKTEQQAISRGLGNTTIRNALLDQDKRRANNAMSDINEQAANRRSALLLQQANQANLGSGRITDFIANRNDVAPDMGMLASLIQNASSQPLDGVQNTARITGGYAIPSDKPGLTNTTMTTSSSGGGSISDALGGGGGGGGSTSGGSGMYFAGPGAATAPTGGTVQVSSPSAVNPPAPANSGMVRCQDNSGIAYWKMGTDCGSARPA